MLQKKRTMINTILNHRTIRNYTTKKVDKELLTKILEAGSRASTTGNMQVYSVVVTQNEGKKKELAPCHFNQPMVNNAPVVLTFCADYNRFNKWCLLRNAQPGFDNFLSFVTGAIDALLVAQNVCLAAEGEGLGICYLGTTIYTADKIIDVLKLPKGVVPITTVTLGYPADNPNIVDRLPLKGIVHYEEYKDYSKDEIAELYFNKEQIAENIGFVKDNNKDSLAQVFTDVRYKKSDNETFSKILLEVIEKQGFMSK